MLPVNPLHPLNVVANVVALEQLANKFSGILPVKPLHPEKVPPIPLADPSSAE